MQMKLNDIRALPLGSKVKVGRSEATWEGVKRNPKVEDPEADGAWVLQFTTGTEIRPVININIKRDDLENLYNVSTNLTDIPCDYCSKLVAASEIINMTIRINRQDQRLPFCSKTCGSYRQMGAEG